MPLSSKMCELSEEQAYEEILTLCQGDSPVSRIRSRENRIEKKTEETYGLNICELCKSVNLLSSWEKMYMEFGVMVMPLKSWQTLKGLDTVLRPSYQLLVRLGDHSHAKECSLLPTPQASDAMSIKKNFKKESIQKALDRGGQKHQWYLLILADMDITLSPILAEWSMGFPENWIALDSMAIQYVHSKDSQFGKK